MILHDLLLKDENWGKKAPKNYCIDVFLLLKNSNPLAGGCWPLDLSSIYLFINSSFLAKMTFTGPSSPNHSMIL